MNTEYIVSSVTLEGEAILTGLRDDAVAAKEGAEDARDAALAAVVPASETVAGIVELATTAEAAAGTDTSRAVTAAGVDAYHKAKNINLGVSVTASGTAVDFVGIPEGVKRINVMLDGVSTSGTSLLLLRVGTSGGIISSGYVSNRGTINGTSVFVANNTAGFDIASPASAAVSQKGDVVLSSIAANKWEARGVIADGASQISTTAGTVTLTGTLDRIRITTANGTDTFDAGTINISWEF